MATDFGRHAYCVAINHRISTGDCRPKNTIAHNASRLDISVQCLKCPQASDA
jgi:hypothetical protein